VFNWDVKRRKERRAKQSETNPKATWFIHHSSTSPLKPLFQPFALSS
jgi:hypothetical protein